MNGETAKGIGIGLLAGAAIGVVLGLLYAPQSGRETRTLVRDRAGTVARKVRARFPRGEEPEQEMAEELMQEA